MLMRLFADAIERVKPLLGLFPLAAGLGLFVSTAGAVEETFPVLETRSGTYSNVVVTTKSKKYIFIHHSAGMASVKIEELPRDAQVRLGYAKEEEEPAGNKINTVLARQLTPEVQAKIKPIENKWRVGITESRKQLNSNPALAYGVLAGFVLIYLFYSYCCHLICIKARRPGGVLVWIPFLQFIPLFRAAGMSGWWFLAVWVPILNIVAHILWALNIAKARGKSVLVGILMILPITNFLAFLYLAFSSGVPEPLTPRYRSMALQTA